VTEREAYEQHRRFQVLNGEIPESDFAVFEEFEDFDDDEDFILADE
jgi:hypothetical protein